MEDLTSLIKSDPQKAIEMINANAKKRDDIDKVIKEFYELDRSQRQTQIGKIQKDKTIDGKVVKAVRIPINFAKKIVQTSVAFEFGEPVTMIPSSKKTITELISKLWRVNRLDDKVLKVKVLRKSQTQSALQFYIKDLEPGSFMQRVLAFFKMDAQKKEIKVNVLDNKNGTMAPYFNEYGDMQAFLWSFANKNAEGKDVKNSWVYDEKFVHKCSDATGIFKLDESVPHGFSKIPIVYDSQEQAEWYDVRDAIDRYEVAISKLGASNDYSGHPMLIIEGEVTNAPDKDEDGKAWIVPITIDDEGKVVKGDVRFLTNDNAPESIELELDKLEDLISWISSTPNLSLNNMKDIGSDSSLAIKLMFLDAIIKAKMNEGENRTLIERILNVFISGITTTTNIKLSKEAEDLFYDVQFNSLLPDDIKTKMEMLSSGVTAKIISKKAATRILDMTDDSEAETAQIALETASEAALPKIKETEKVAN